jgi:hypothetical protein
VYKPADQGLVVTREHDCIHAGLMATAVRISAGVLLCAWALLGCSGKGTLGKRCSFDDQCIQEKGIVCVGAEGLGFGECGCYYGSSWHSLFGKCVDDSLLKIRGGTGSKKKNQGEQDHSADAGAGSSSSSGDGFADPCQEVGDCAASTGLECVAKKCLCNPPGDSTVRWYWSKKHPDRDCRVTAGKRYFGSKIICDKTRPKPGEFHIPARVWWNDAKGRCLSLRERRSLSVTSDIRFVDWGEAMRDFR